MNTKIIRRTLFHTDFTILLFLFLFLLSACVKDDPPKNTFTLPSTIIHKIVIDKNGTKWVATEKGLVCFDGNKWNPYPEIPFENKNRIPDMAIGALETNKIWFAGNEGVNYLKFTPTDIIASWSYQAATGKLLDDTVTAVAIDILNVKYFGTPLGLSILKGDQWAVFEGRPTEEILREYKISSIASARNGWVYAATLGGGVSRFKYTDAVSGATTIDSIWSPLKSNFINTVVITDDTCQWYGTNHGAAYHTSIYTKIRADWKTYTKADGLISDTVLSIAKDKSGNMWFGTNNGLSKYDGNAFTSYTTSDGLVDNKVNTISVDNDGSLWFGTENGLSHFKDGIWKNFVPD
jgi:ligand-binding sensor domain-containing protein